VFICGRLFFGILRFRTVRPRFEHSLLPNLPLNPVFSAARRLLVSETERQIVIIALDMIVEDCPLSRVADELNRRGHTTREGTPWTPSTLYTLLPRMIQVGPKVFRSDEWVTRKKRLPRVV